jgi:hypothetical protein
LLAVPFIGADILTGIYVTNGLSSPTSLPLWCSGFSCTSTVTIRCPRGKLLLLQTSSTWLIYPIVGIISSQQAYFSSALGCIDKYASTLRTASSIVQIFR